AAGAIFAALNTMYSAVSTRTMEIATLRAIGFGSGAVVISVLVEALLLAIVGALVGAFLAWLVFNGNTVSTISGNQGVAQIAFKLRIGGDLVVVGILWACVVGLIGGCCRLFERRGCLWRRRCARGSSRLCWRRQDRRRYFFRPRLDGRPRSAGAGTALLSARESRRAQEIWGGSRVPAHGLAHLASDLVARLERIRGRGALTPVRRARQVAAKENICGDPGARRAVRPSAEG